MVAIKKGKKKFSVVRIVCSASSNITSARKNLLRHTKVSVHLFTVFQVWWYWKGFVQMGSRLCTVQVLFLLIWSTCFLGFELWVCFYPIGLHLPVRIETEMAHCPAEYFWKPVLCCEGEQWLNNMWRWLWITSVYATKAQQLYPQLDFFLEEPLILMATLWDGKKASGENE